MLNIPEEIKQLFRQGSVKKNLRIHFPNGEREDITNKNLIAESFSFEESICSENTLKFGLSEASSVEFETVGVGNIKGCEIKVFHEIDISSLSEDFISEYGIRSEDLPFPYYKIPYGYFTVDSCQRQSDMNRRKITAYDKLSSKSLDYDKTEEINNYLKSKPAFSIQTVYTLEKMMLDDFNISHERKKIPVEYQWGSDERDIYEGDVLSVDGSKDTNFEVQTRTFVFENIESTEVYDVIIPTVGLFAGKHGLLKIYQDREGFKLGTNDYWWLDHGLEVELTDINSNKLIFTEYDSVNEVLSIFGCGNIAEIRIRFVGYIGLAWHDEYGEVDDLYSYIDEAERKALMDSISIESLDLYDIERKPIPPALNSCTLRNILNAVYEINGTFATISRESGMLEERKIGGGGLYPSDTLYPSNDLLPKGSMLFTKSMYKSAWYDDEYTPKYSKITCTYKNSDTSEKEYLEYVIVEVEDSNKNNYQIYDISDNYIIKEFTFTELEILKILTTLAFNIKDIKYMPAEVDLIALPYLESGEIISVLTNDDGFETIVLRRTLTGIQALSDNFESRG